MFDDGPEVGEPQDGGAGVPPTPEEPKEATPERTVDTEVQTNVDLWKDRKVKVDPELVEIRIRSIPDVEKLLNEGYVVLFLPKGIKTGELLEENVAIGPGDKQQPRSNAKKSYAIAFRYQQEPDEDTLGENAKSAEDWENTGETLMSPLERLAADYRWDWDHEETTSLDEKHATLCPGYRTRDGKVPAFGNDPEDDEVRMYPRQAGDLFPGAGVRRVVPGES